MQDLDKWWSKLAFRSGGRVEGPTDATGDEDFQYWWLLPGDVSYSAASSPADPEIGRFTSAAEKR